MQKTIIKKTKVMAVFLSLMVILSFAFSGVGLKNVEAADNYQTMKSGETVTFDFNKISDGKSTEKTHIKYLQIVVPEAGLVEFDTAYVDHIEDNDINLSLYELEVAPDYLGNIGTKSYSPAGWGSFHVTKDGEGEDNHADFFLAKGTYRFKIKTSAIYDQVDKKYVFPVVKLKYKFTGYESQYKIDIFSPVPLGQKGDSADNRYIWNVDSKENINIFYTTFSSFYDMEKKGAFGTYFRVEIPKDGKYVSLKNYIREDINGRCDHKFSGYVDNYCLKDRTGNGVSTKSEKVNNKNITYYELKKGTYLMYVQISSWSVGGFSSYKIEELDKYIAETNSNATETSKYSNEWVNGKWYDANGKQTYKGTLKWKSDANGWWVEDSEGWYPTSQWQKIDGKWYYFTASGYMDYSEYREGCWLNADGSMDPNFTHGTWHSDSNGWWYEDNGWYPCSQYLWIDGVQYWFDASGYMR